MIEPTLFLVSWVTMSLLIIILLIIRLVLTDELEHLSFVVLIGFLLWLSGIMCTNFLTERWDISHSQTIKNGE